MAQTPENWNTKEEVTSTKLNNINTTLMGNIVDNEMEIGNVKNYNQQARAVILGNGIYQGFELTEAGLDITLTAGAGIVGGVVVLTAEKILTLTDDNINYIYLNNENGIEQSTLPENIGTYDQELYEVEVSGGSIIGIIDKRKQLDTLETIYNTQKAEINKKKTESGSGSETIIASGETVINITHIEGICGEPAITLDNVNVSYEITGKTDSGFDLKLINTNTAEETVNYTWERKVIEL
jgi:hypothetical protein